MPKISIIIPIYNVELFLRQSLDSVVSQTFTDFEAICVNDGSPDNCHAILEEYATKDSRIIVINQENQGVSVARNTALAISQGDYIAFLDPDDIMHPQFLELMLQKIEETNADVICCKYKEIEENESLTTHKHITTITCFEIPLHFDRFAQRIKPYPTITLWNKLYKAEIINTLRFEPHITVAEDVFFMHSLLYNAQKVYYTEEILLYYRQRKSSLTNTNLQDIYIDDHITIVKTLMHQFENIPMQEVSKKALFYNFTKMLCKACITFPYHKAYAQRNIFWNKYSDVLLNLLQEGTYTPEILDIRNRFLTYLFIRKKFTLLNFILQF